MSTMILRLRQNAGRKHVNDGRGMFHLFAKSPDALKLAAATARRQGDDEDQPRSRTGQWSRKG